MADNYNIFDGVTGSSNRTAKSLLNKYYKVVDRIDNPKFVPYNKRDEATGEEVIEDGKHVVVVSPLTDFMYYHKLPEVYREFDEPLGNPLYRYLQSLLDGGYAEVVYSDTVGQGGIENLLELIDPEKCPNKFLPYYCESMGIQWFYDLSVASKEGKTNDNDYYNRTFLCNIGEIYRRRGTESVVKYIAKVLTEMDVILDYERVYDTDGKTTKSRILWVEMQAESQEQIDNVGLSAKVIKRYIDTQIPYYITTAVVFVLKFKSQSGLYNGNFVRSTINKTIKCEDRAIKTSITIQTDTNIGIVGTKTITQTVKSSPVEVDPYEPIEPVTPSAHFRTSEGNPVVTADGKYFRVLKQTETE